MPRGIRVRQLVALLSVSPLLGTTAVYANHTADSAQAQAVAALGTNYAFTDLGTAGGSQGGPDCNATAINDSGDITGWSLRSDNREVAFRWRDGVMTALPTLPGLDASHFLLGGEGLAINDSGQIAGEAGRPPGEGTPPNFDLVIHAAVWSDKSVSELGGFSKLQVSTGRGINNSYQVVGVSRDLLLDTVGAFLWEDGAVTDLGSLGGGRSEANGINQKGQVVGTSTLVTVGSQHAFLWDKGSMTDLGVLPGFDVGSIGNAISDRGLIVGASFSGYSGGHAFLWRRSSGMSDLGALLQDGTSDALAINSSAEVVGTATATPKNVAVVNGREDHAVLWKDGALIDLNNLLPAGFRGVLLSATGINDVGQIVGNFDKGFGQVGCFLLSPSAEASETVRD